MPTEKPICKQARAWLETNYGRGLLAPFTGTDYRAFHAFVHVVELWAHSRRVESFAAAQALLLEMQVKNRDIAIAIVPMIADWQDEIMWRRAMAARGVEGVDAVAGLRRAPARRPTRGSGVIIDD